MEPHVATRKRLKRDAAKRLGISPEELGWVDGTLVFLTTNLTVEGVPHVRKPTHSSRAEPSRTQAPRNTRPARHPRQPQSAFYWGAR